MFDNYYWKKFEKTGNISDYLHYACTSEESLTKGREEGNRSDEQRNSFRDRIISRTGR